MGRTLTIVGTKNGFVVASDPSSHTDIGESMVFESFEGLDQHIKDHFCPMGEIPKPEPLIVPDDVERTTKPGQLKPPPPEKPEGLATTAINPPTERCETVYFHKGFEIIASLYGHGTHTPVPENRWGFRFLLARAETRSYPIKKYTFPEAKASFEADCPLFKK